MKRVLIMIAFGLLSNTYSSAQQTTYELEIKKVIDATSFELVSGRRIKMLGVEIIHEKEREARSYIESVVQPGTIVYFEVDKVLTDDDNNIIGYIFSDKLFLNIELIKRGLAKFSDKYPVTMNLPQFQDNYEPELPEEVVNIPEEDVNIKEEVPKEINIPKLSSSDPSKEYKIDGESFILAGGEIKENPNYKMLYLENLTLHWQSNTVTSALFSYVNPFDDLIAKGWNASLTFGRYFNFNNIMTNTAMPYISMSMGVTRLDLQDINYAETYSIKRTTLVDVSYNFGILYKRKKIIARIEFKNNNYYNHRNNTLFDGKTYLFGIGYRYRS